MDKNRFPIGVQRLLYAKYRTIDSELIDFVKFARKNLMPVSYALTRERTQVAA